MNVIPILSIISIVIMVFIIVKQKEEIRVCKSQNGRTQIFLKEQYVYFWQPSCIRPKKSGRYLVFRDGCKCHLEVWNGSGWAYNHKTITHWAEIKIPTI